MLLFFDALFTASAFHVTDWSWLYMGCPFENKITKWWLHLVFIFFASYEFKDCCTSHFHQVLFKIDIFIIVILASPLFIKKSFLLGFRSSSQTMIELVLPEITTSGILYATYLT